MKIRLDTTLQGDNVIKEDLQIIEESSNTWKNWLVFADNNDIAEPICADNVLEFMQLAYNAGKNGEEFIIERDTINETTEEENNYND